MTKVENFRTYGWESCIYGMRNPMNSWDKIDTDFALMYKGVPAIGTSDLDLMKRLCKGGSDDRKFLRQIFVTCDITAPFYWWKEMDQYKVGTVTNSCSTMHKIASKEFTIDDFSHEHLVDESDEWVYNGWLHTMGYLVRLLNRAREKYLETKDKKYWWQMIQLLPSSYNQKRTWSANYEVLRNIYHARKSHKLDEWRDFCKEIEKLPYAKELIIGDE